MSDAGDERRDPAGTSAARPWSRRRWLLAGGTALGAAGAGVGGWALWRWRRFADLSPGARRMAWSLSARADRLGIAIASDDIIRDWISDRERFHGAIDPGTRGATWPNFEWFMLSTDAFDAGTGDAVTRYVSHYDPHHNPCYNPLRQRADASEG